MIDSIPPLGPGLPIDPGRAPGVGPSQGPSGFGEILQEAIRKVGDLQVDADRMLAQVNKGEASMQDVAVQFRKAQMAFETLMQVRTRLEQSLDELMRMRF